MGTAPAPRPAGRGAFVPDVRAAAAVEARALGHARVEVGHLLLGLRALGGPSAHALTAAGVGLPDLRGMVARVGAGSGPGPAAAGRPVRAADRREAYTMPISEDAREVLDRVTFRRSDGDLLGALLTADDGAALDLLEGVGASGDEVAHLLARPFPGDLAAAPSPVGAPETGVVWLGAAHSHLLTAPLHRVWALLSDPHRRPEWDLWCAALVVLGEGVERVVDPDGTVVEHVLAQSLPEEAIGWRWPAPAAAGRPWTKELQVRLDAQGDRTIARLTMLVRGRPLVAHLGRPVFARIMSKGLRILAQGINQAAG